MTTVSKYPTPAAAGAEVHTRATANGGTYREAVHAMLKADPALAEA